MTGRLVPILPAQAVPLLANAFAKDPVFDYFTQPAPFAAREVLRQRLVAWIIRFHHLSGQPLLGWQVEGQMIGCALVEDHPAPLRRAYALARMLPDTMCLPFAVLPRLNAYGVTSARGRPPGVTHFLALIGLCETAQGQGHGGRFLDALHARYGAAAHWALDTENPANPAFYGRFGYLQYATEPLGSILMFKLHRPPTVTGSNENKP